MLIMAVKEPDVLDSDIGRLLKTISRMKNTREARKNG